MFMFKFLIVLILIILFLYLHPLFIKAIRLKLGEGILITRNGRVYSQDVKGEGGYKFIYPILGDEVVARTSVGLNQHTWESKKELVNRRGVKFKLTLLVTWKVSDLAKYLFERNYFDLSQKELVVKTNEWIDNLVDVAVDKYYKNLEIREIVQFLPIFTGIESANSSNLASFTLEDIMHKARVNIQNKSELIGVDIVNLEIQDISLDKDLQKAIDIIYKAFFDSKAREYKGQAMLNQILPLLDQFGIDKNLLTDLIGLIGGIFTNENKKNLSSNKNIHPLLRD